MSNANALVDGKYILIIDGTRHVAINPANVTTIEWKANG